MDYIDKTLGIKVVYEDTETGHYPNFISTRYRLQMVSLEGQKAIFLYPKTELEQIETLKKHIDRIRTNEKLPVVLILNELTFRQKEYLIREKIPFVVEGKQIYLPFMAVYLQERCDAEKKSREEILPSAQMLFLRFLYLGAQELPMSQAAKDLNLTPMSISRAARQLAEMKLLSVRKDGVQKILFSSETPELLFQKAKGKLLNPVKRTVYVSGELVDTGLLKSGYSALAEYSMLNTPNVQCFASDTVSEWQKSAANTLQDSKTQVAVELWRYDPKKLADGKTVDVLSLALSLEDDRDERVEEAVEEMLGNLWRQIDGHRD